MKTNPNDFFNKLKNTIYRNNGWFENVVNMSARPSFIFAQNRVTTTEREYSNLIGTFPLTRVDGIRASPVWYLKSSESNGIQMMSCLELRPGRCYQFDHNNHFYGNPKSPRTQPVNNLTLFYTPPMYGSQPNVRSLPLSKGNIRDIVKGNYNSFHDNIIITALHENCLPTFKQRQNWEEMILDFCSAILCHHYNMVTQYEKPRVNIISELYKTIRSFDLPDELYVISGYDVATGNTRIGYNETKKLTYQNLVRSVGSLVRTSPLNNSDLQTNLSSYTSDNNYCTISLTPMIPVSVLGGVQSALQNILRDQLHTEFDTWNNFIYYRANCDSLPNFYDNHNALRDFPYWNFIVCDVCGFDKLKSSLVPNTHVLKLVKPKCNFKFKFTFFDKNDLESELELEVPHQLYQGSISTEFHDWFYEDLKSHISNLSADFDMNNCGIDFDFDHGINCEQKVEIVL
jgi:hypothetical protein